MKSRFLLIPLLLFMIGCSVEDTVELPEEEKTAFETMAENSELKILAIGNSFTVNAAKYLPQIMNANDTVPVLFCRLIQAGSSLRMHWENHLDSTPAYDSHIIYGPSWYQHDFLTLDAALTATQWDVVVLQQVSYYAGLESSYEPFFTNLKNLIAFTNPGASIVWHETWAFSSDSTHPSFDYYNYDRKEMFEKILEATNKVRGKVDLVIPSGEIIEELRDSKFNSPSDLTADGFHLDEGLPCYALSCLWHEMLVAPFTGKSCLGNNLRPREGKVDVSDEAAQYVFELVKKYAERK